MVRRCRMRSVWMTIVVASSMLLAAPAVRGELAVTADPVSPTETDTFDLSVLGEFNDAGYGWLDQSIVVDGDQIDVDVVMQDLHTQPGMAFAQVITTSGAMFEDLGPLAAGTYQVNARMWLATWPDTEPGYLYDIGSLTLHSATPGLGGAAPEPGAAVLMLVGAGLFALRRKLG